ncbi:MAG: hypothetical protein B6D62_04905 [Candidatus Cloacimonas sp. 4484_275]|nr:MAG: hypothetical protein B6D62_04905 [Candidatus Cloacimonas sp. 4484_275]
MNQKQIYFLENFSFRYPYSEKAIQWSGNISINENEILLISGKSGAGKSTFLYALKGLLPDTIFGKLKGKILFKGKDVSQLSSFEKAKIGFLFQNPAAQMINRTVIQEIAFGMENLQMKQQEDYLKDSVSGFIKIGANGKIEKKDLKEIPWTQKFPRLPNISKGEKLIEIKNLSFSYDNNHILKGLNFELRKKEIIGIIGANGAGKTTLLKLIAGVLKSKNGKISYKHENIEHISFKKYYRNLALLFQNPENHFLFSEVEREIAGNRKILDLVGLNKMQKRNPFTLSEGEKRRLSLAILWNLKREIFLFDEPTFGQDYENKNKLIELIGKMREKGNSFIIVSHDYPFLNSVCDKIFLLKNGYLRETQIQN